MSGLENWLKEKERVIHDGIMEGRRYDHYFGEVIESDGSFYIFKPDGKPKTITRDRMTIIELPTIKSYNVEPERILIKLMNDWKQIYEMCVNIVFGALIASLKRLERKKIIDTLTKDAEEVTIDSEFSNIHEAYDIIESNGGYPDTMLVNFKKLSDFNNLKEFTPFYRLPKWYIEQNGGLHLRGILRHILVFGTNGLSRDEGVLYSKREARLKMTPLKVKFDNYDDPRCLEIYEELYAWPLYEGTVVKLKF